eukprot:2636659-Pyramimonas_sp.AAC.1
MQIPADPPLKNSRSRRRLRWQPTLMELPGGPVRRPTPFTSPSPTPPRALPWQPLQTPRQPSGTE